MYDVSFYTGIIETTSIFTTSAKEARLYVGMFVSDKREKGVPCVRLGRSDADYGIAIKEYRWKPGKEREDSEALRVGITFPSEFGHVISLTPRSHGDDSPRREGYLPVYGCDERVKNTVDEIVLAYTVEKAANATDFEKLVSQACRSTRCHTGSLDAAQ